ncbi:MAG: ABC transporter ATP-binding protein, partial [Nitrospinales bacterium]
MGKQKSFSQILSTLWQVVHRFMPEIRKHRAMVLGAFVAMGTSIVMKALEPWPLKFILDYIILAGSAGKTLNNPFIETFSPETLLILAAVAFIAFSGLAAWSDYKSTVGFASVGNHVMTKARNDLFVHIQSLPISFHAKSQKGDLLMRAIGDVRLLREALVTAAMPLLASISILLVMLAVMLWLNWKLALVALAIAPVFLFALVKISKKIHAMAFQQRQTQSVLASTLAQSVEAIKTVQAFSLENGFFKNFFHDSHKNSAQNVKTMRLTAGLLLSTNMLIALATAMVLGYGTLLVLRNEMSPGDLIVFLSYLKSAFKPLRSSTKASGRLTKAVVAGERVMELLDLKPEVRDLPNAVTAPPFKGAIRFEGVDFAYQNAPLTLKEVNFDVRPGRQIALVAPSGSGKSTLVNLILRFYDPSNGRVLIDGQDIRSYTLNSLRSQISVVLQDALLFSSSVRENIAYGKPNATLEEIEAAARAANAHEFIMALPQGYETAIGEGGWALSSGQRQRISIARTIIRNSPILILDEPTTGLDKKNAREIMALLAKVS